MYTVKKAAELTGIAETTIKLYCRNGKFPNAVKERTSSGDYWMIPEEDLHSITKAGGGRPKKSTDRSTVAEDAGQSESVQAEKRLTRKIN